MSRKRRKLPVAAVLSYHDRFSTMSPDQKERILQKVKERPTEWRLAVIFKTTHQPEVWAAGEIYNAAREVLGLVGRGKDAKAFMRSTLAKLLRPGVPAYEELKKDIFGS